MEFTDLIALKIKEMMNEKELSIYKLESLTGVYTSTISQFLTRKLLELKICYIFVKHLVLICLNFFLIQDLMKQKQKVGWRGNKIFEKNLTNVYNSSIIILGNEHTEMYVAT